jgi:hypothetical protein
MEFHEKSVCWKSRYSMRTDGRKMDKHDKANSRFSRMLCAKQLQTDVKNKRGSLRASGLEPLP